MKFPLLASVAMAGMLLIPNLRALGAAPDPSLSAFEIVTRMVEADERNFELARRYEFDQQTITQELDDEDRPTETATATVRQRLQRGINYRVEGVKGEGKEVKTSVGSAPSESGEEEGVYGESMTLRELSRFHDYHREPDEKLDGIPHYVLTFKPKSVAEMPKTQNRDQKVLANLMGKLWIHPDDWVIVRSDSRLSRPLPFAIVDLVSLRSLHVLCEAAKKDGSVWLPTRTEVTYAVRLVYVAMLRERQISTMKNFRKADGAP